jgi:FtsP/CotA-like multicopper oxidase with cupredoxin domain
MRISRQLRCAMFVVVFWSVFAHADPVEVCPRPAVGSTVADPKDLRSENGTLRVELEYRSFVDTQGQARFCFLSKDGSLAPNLRVQPGDELILNLKNGLPAASSATPKTMGHAMSPNPCTTGPMSSDSTNLHFHGLVIAPTCHQDDTLNTSIQPSDPPFEYRFKVPATQPPGLYWYHPHIHGFTRAQILGGASGALIVEGIEAANPQLRGLPERVLVIRDQELLHPDAEEIWKGPGPAPIVVRDADGDVRNTGTGTGKPAKDLSINFVPVPFPEYQPAIIAMRPSEKQFWRVLNASAITYVDLRLLFNNVPQSVGLVALDGAALNHENPAKETIEWKSHILLPPAGRAEFIINGPHAGVRTSLVTRSIDTGPVGDNDPVRPLATIQVGEVAPEPHSIPLNAGKAPAAHSSPLGQAKPVRQRLLYFSEKVLDPRNPSSPTVFYLTVDGQDPKPFDPNSTLPNITVQSGEVEDWVIENRSKELHTFHIHQTHFQLLEWNGRPVDEPYLRDTVNVDYWREKITAYPSVKLRMDFRDPAIVGTFAYHCHMLEHQDNGMMGIIRVEPR